MFTVRSHISAYFTGGSNSDSSNINPAASTGRMIRFPMIHHCGADARGQAHLQFFRSFGWLWRRQ